MQAITTKFLSPTNVRGSRYKATAQAGSVTVHSDHSKNFCANHKAAAEALARKMGWCGTWIGGFDVNQHGVWVCVDHRMSDQFSIPERAAA